MLPEQDRAEIGEDMWGYRCDINLASTGCHGSQYSESYLNFPIQCWMMLNLDQQVMVKFIMPETQLNYEISLGLERDETIVCLIFNTIGLCRIMTGGRKNFSLLYWRGNGGKFGSVFQIWQINSEYLGLQRDLTLWRDISSLGLWLLITTTSCRRVLESWISRLLVAWVSRWLISTSTSRRTAIPSGIIVSRRGSRLVSAGHIIGHR